MEHNKEGVLHFLHTLTLICFPFWLPCFWHVFFSDMQALAEKFGAGMVALGEYTRLLPLSLSYISDGHYYFIQNVGKSGNDIKKRRNARIPISHRPKQTYWFDPGCLVSQSIVSTASLSPSRSSQQTTCPIFPPDRLSRTWPPSVSSIRWRAQRRTRRSAVIKNERSIWAVNKYNSIKISAWKQQTHRTYWIPLSPPSSPPPKKKSHDFMSPSPPPCSPSLPHPRQTSTPVSTAPPVPTTLGSSSASPTRVPSVLGFD